MMALWFLIVVLCLALVAVVVRSWTKDFEVPVLDHVFAPAAEDRRIRTVERLGRMS